MAIDIRGVGEDPFVSKKQPAHSSFINLDQERAQETKKKTTEQYTANRNNTWNTKEASDYCTRDAEHAAYDVTESLSHSGTELSSHSEEIHYYNNTNSDFYVTSNNGLCRELKGNGTFVKDKNTLIIKRVYIFSSMESIKFSLDEFTRYLKITGNKATDSARIINKTLKDFYTHKKDSNGRFIGKQVSVSIDYLFDTRSISDNGIYIPDLDLVLSPNCNSVHPADSNFKTIDKMSKMTEEYGCVGVIVEMVDNDKKYDTKYVYVAGSVQKVAPVIDTTKQNGVTVLRVTTDKSGAKKTEKISFMSIDEALEKGIIHNTHESAFTNGDPGKLHDAASQKMKLDLEGKRYASSVSKIEAERISNQQKLEHDRAIAELKATQLKTEQDYKNMQTRLEQEHKNAQALYEQNARAAQIKADQEHKTAQAQMEQEQKMWENNMRRRMMAMNDEYESRSYNRKDNSEAAKSIPGLITAVAATAAAVFAVTRLT